MHGSRFFFFVSPVSLKTDTRSVNTFSGVRVTFSGVRVWLRLQLWKQMYVLQRLLPNTCVTRISLFSLQGSKCSPRK